MNRVIDVDVREVVQLSLALEGAAAAFGTGSARAVNRVASEARKETGRSIVSQVRLTPEYVDRKVELRAKATQSKPSATLAVDDEPVFISRYETQQRTTSNVWTEARYASTFGSLAAQARLPNGRLAPWVPRTGDKLRSIPAGQKQAGMNIGIHTGKGVKAFPYVFVHPIRDGKALAGRWGAFSRPKGGGKPYGMYGPSVYQVTKGVWRDSVEPFTDMLEAALVYDVFGDFEEAVRLGKQQVDSR